MTFAVTISTEGAAFDDAPKELARLLCQVAGKLRLGEDAIGRVLLDINGNACGVWGFQTTEERPNA
jgi:hypothetical protein